MSNIGTKFNLDNRFTFDPNTNSLVDKENENELIRLGSNESRILLLLCEKPSEIVSRNELHDFVWRKQGFEVDDSSLTQAISTLRKLLKDSTKSPMFVKTVPKRGYQLICSVERVTSLLSGEAQSEESQDSETGQEQTPVGSATPAFSADLQDTVSAPEPESRSSSILTKLMLIVALLLPLCALLFNNPTESEFVLLGEVENTLVKMPVNHPDLSKWYPAIEQCVRKYKETRLDELAPLEVIATGGQNNQLVLNYIHSMDYSGESISIRIYAEQQDLNRICQ